MKLSCIYILNLLLNVCLATSIKGKFEFSLGNLTKNAIRRTSFSLYQIGNYSTQDPYKATTHLLDLDGNFKFDDLPINKGINETTYFVLSSSSLDYNLYPNRILVEFIQLENGTSQMSGFKNYFGREYFPSKDIIHADKLEQITTEPHLTISVIQKAPFRAYFQTRNSGIMNDNGIVGSILNSRWKLAGVITIICVFAFPMFIDKIDPESAIIMREEALKKKKEQYAN
ncbi:similar to Saccharomyces cerevisiae YJL192C SOP4 ER-membrane protein [Maudiozyma barnettii]|uniref:Protein SOP4 n=1 Tax=Maudiozyma barnettii TaxID=61262 RepID=A0A8H2VGE1_9SACH|nr:Sop4p [Kazachstania barnettii]CAB4254699.1 similar to Saccharomyces cerevisiae YJL192C SOP4 ER-membrane protein [Kazachstania barnettii]CAD1782741.1 similar to Saccharomyces cerevisiae YJL192C SOP4 ER-membrane protein [Kazachstania barnettii]